MAANKKPKKKYRPKGIIQDPIRYVMVGIKPANTDIQLNLKIKCHDAMFNLTHGKGTKDDWQVVADALNVSMVLWEMGYGQEYLDDIGEAMSAMNSIRDRYKKDGSLVLRGPEMKVINDGLDLHDQQIEIVPIHAMEKALRSVNERLNRGVYHQGRLVTCSAI